MKISLLFWAIVLMNSCQSSHENREHKVKVRSSDAISFVPDSTDSVRVYPNENIYITARFLETLKPIMGDRLSVTGDFDGDGKDEILTEVYYSLTEKRETCKDYEGIGYDTAVSIACYKNPYSFLLSSNKEMDTLRIAQLGQLFGVLYLKNEGDLTGDGTDELSYMVDYADWSSLNSLKIVTYKDHKWVDLYSFTVMEYQLDSDKPLIRKVSDNIIEIQSYFNLDGEDFGAEENYFKIDLRNPPDKY